VTWVPVHPRIDAHGPMISAPLLDLATPQLFRHAARLSCERGAFLTRDLAGLHPYWAVSAPFRWNSDGECVEVWEDLGHFVKETGLRPLLFGVTRADGHDGWYVCSDAAEPVLEEQVQALAEAPNAQKEPRYEHVSSLQYILSSAIYHTKQLALLYSNTLAEHRERDRGREWSRDYISSANEPYFEFEAGITAIIRGYDTLRHFVWSACGAQGTRPSNFAKVVHNVTLPEPLAARAGEAVELYERAKEYRHCIQHYTHFGVYARTRVRLHKARVWTYTTVLPDNPEARSQSEFRFSNFESASGIDALTYLWESTAALVRLAKLMVIELAPVGAGNDSR
jgi:hypothetical protein